MLEFGAWSRTEREGRACGVPKLLRAYTYRRPCGRDCRCSWGSGEDEAHLALAGHSQGPGACLEDSPLQMQPSVRDESVRFVQKLRPFVMALNIRLIDQAALVRIIITIDQLSITFRPSV